MDINNSFTGTNLLLSDYLTLRALLDTDNNFQITESDFDTDGNGQASYKEFQSVFQWACDTIINPDLKKNAWRVGFQQFREWQYVYDLFDRNHGLNDLDLRTAMDRTMFCIDGHESVGPQYMVPLRSFENLMSIPLDARMMPVRLGVWSQYQYNFPCPVSGIGYSRKATADTLRIFINESDVYEKFNDLKFLESIDSSLLAFCQSIAVIDLPIVKQTNGNTEITITTLGTHSATGGRSYISLTTSLFNESNTALAETIFSHEMGHFFIAHQIISFDEQEWKTAQKLDNKWTSKYAQKKGFEEDFCETFGLYCYFLNNPFPTADEIASLKHEYTSLSNFPQDPKTNYFESFKNLFPNRTKLLDFFYQEIYEKALNAYRG